MIGYGKRDSGVERLDQGCLLEVMLVTIHDGSVKPDPCSLLTCMLFSGCLRHVLGWEEVYLRSMGQLLRKDSPTVMESSDLHPSVPQQSLHLPAVLQLGPPTS